MIDEIITQARNEVYKENIDKPAYRKNKILRQRLNQMRGFCREVAEKVAERLKKQGKNPKLYAVESPRRGGGNHIVVYVPSENIIIDPTMDQYGIKEKVYKFEDYPTKIK